MSATPDSTLVNSKHLADLQRQLAEREAELAECRAERDEALQRETATAEVLQVINSSPGELAPVFDAMLEKATRLCDAGFGILWTFDGQSLQAVALYGVSAEFAEVLKQPIDVTDSPVLAEIVGGCGFVQSVDLAATQGYRDGNFLRRATVDLGGAQTGLAVALRRDNALLGIFATYRTRFGHSPTSKSHYCRISPPKRSLPWKMRGC